MKSLLFILFLATSTTISAQNQFGQTSLNVGGSYNAWRWIHKVPFKEYDKKFDFTVGTQAALDWGLFRRMSIGFGFCTQKHILRIANYTYNDGASTVTENPTQFIRTSSYSVRGLLHHLSFYESTNEKFDFYYGLAHNIMLVQTSNTSEDPNFPKYEEYIENIPSGIVGLRYFTSPNVGCFVEVAAPGPYTISLGVSGRFGGREKFFGR